MPPPNAHTCRAESLSLAPPPADGRSLKKASMSSRHCEVLTGSTGGTVILPPPPAMSPVIVVLPGPLEVVVRAGPYDVPPVLPPHCGWSRSICSETASMTAAPYRHNCPITTSHLGDGGGGSNEGEEGGGAREKEKFPHRHSSSV